MAFNSYLSWFNILTYWNKNLIYLPPKITKLIFWQLIKIKVFVWGLGGGYSFRWGFRLPMKLWGNMYLSIQQFYKYFFYPSMFRLDGKKLGWLCQLGKYKKLYCRSKWQTSLQGNNSIKEVLNGDTQVRLQSAWNKFGVTRNNHELRAMQVIKI